MRTIFERHTHLEKNQHFFSEKACVHKETNLERKVKPVKQTKMRQHKTVTITI